MNKKFRFLKTYDMFILNEQEEDLGLDEPVEDTGEPVEGEGGEQTKDNEKEYKPIDSKKNSSVAVLKNALKEICNYITNNQEKIERKWKRSIVDMELETDSLKIELDEEDTFKWIMTLKEDEPMGKIKAISSLEFLVKIYDSETFDLVLDKQPTKLDLAALDKDDDNNDIVSPEEAEEDENISVKTSEVIDMITDVIKNIENELTDKDGGTITNNINRFM